MVEYWKGKLNAAARSCYERILAGLRKYQESIECNGMDQRDIFDAYFAVYNDHPEIFYMSNAPRINQQEVKSIGLFSTTNLYATLVASNIYDRRTIERCDQQIKKIVSIFDKNMNDFDLVLRCMEYIVLNTEYKIDNQLNQNAAAALCYHRAQCSGISKAVKILLDNLNIFCIVVEGMAMGNAKTQEPHAWNIVQVNGQFYHIDATYMLGANMGKHLPLYRKFIFYDDIAMSKTHNWDRTKVPACQDGGRYPTLNLRRFFPKREVNKEVLQSFKSLYEFKTAVRKMVSDGLGRMRFVMDIPVSTEGELRRLLESSCNMVFDQMNNISYFISIADNREVTLIVTY